MAFIEWNKTYSVGVDLFDSQHQELVNAINELHQAMRDGKGNSVLESIINKLITYAGTHFQDEEKLFAEYSYPDSDKHIEEHKKFLEEVLSFQEDFKKEKLFLSVEILDFLKDWLIKHILASDKEYGPYLNSKGIL